MCYPAVRFTVRGDIIVVFGTATFLESQPPQANSSKPADNQMVTPIDLASLFTSSNHFVLGLLGLLPSTLAVYNFLGIYMSSIPCTWPVHRNNFLLMLLIQQPFLLNHTILQTDY
jgi:hypothetical protein